METQRPKTGSQQRYAQQNSAVRLSQSIHSPRRTKTGTHNQSVKVRNVNSRPFPKPNPPRPAQHTPRQAMLFDSCGEKKRPPQPKANPIGRACGSALRRPIPTTSRKGLHRYSFPRTPPPAPWRPSFFFTFFHFSSLFMPLKPLVPVNLLDPP